MNESSDSQVDIPSSATQGGSRSTAQRSRVIVSLALLVAPLLAVWSCAKDGEQREIILRVASWGSPAIESGFLELERELRRTFEAMHPGVRVQMEMIPGEGQYAPKLLMMHVSGSMPDVVHLDASSAAVFVDNHVVRDLTSLIDGDAAFDIGAYRKNVVDIARRGDALYAVPLDFTPMVLYYNKTLFDEAGVPYPRAGWTWDEFLRAAKALTITPQGAEHPTQFGYNFINWMPGWILWLWTNGGDVLDPTGSRATGFFDGTESIEAIRFLVDLIEKHHVAPSLEEGAIAGVDLFRAGQAAMDVKGHWMMLDYRAEGIDFGVAPLPTNTGEPVTVIYEAGLAIPCKARHPNLAWEYIKFMTRQDIQTRRVSSGLAISANNRAAAHFSDNIVEKAFLDIAEAGRAPWGARVEQYPFIEDLGREMMEDILYGDVAVEDALRRTAKLIDQVLARH